MTITLADYLPLAFLIAGTALGYILGNRDRTLNPRIPPAPRVPSFEALGYYEDDEDEIAAPCRVHRRPRESCRRH